MSPQAPATGRVLALDVGEKRIGLAISDPEGRLAVPLETIHRSEEASDLRAIAVVVEREEVARLLVGLPLSLDGSVGPQAQLVQDFARRLAAAVPRPVELWDERLSTVEAGARSPPRGRRPPSGGRSLPSRKSTSRRRKGEVDSLAASIFLQGYLDRRRAADPLQELPCRHGH